MSKTATANPSEEKLSHYGVKGMQWGVRNAHPHYSEGQQALDIHRFGDRGANRINRRLHKGKTHEQAVKTEKRQRVAKTAALVIYGAFVAKNLTNRYGPRQIGSIATKRATKAGAKAAANLLADSHGLTGYSAIHLTYNAAKNVWE